ncbi:CE1759 family FMN reductase [Nocardia grenadensis]|uniref:CE1759 family FMN reductase n=1 Tax=Nocardia grenadensis TaxID=931537 RepID=UPI0007A425E4|nr:CE1759 family FMN reductase [Nocardia grenadensis]
MNTTNGQGTTPYRLVVVSGGTSNPSSTRMLADRVAARVGTLARHRGATATVHVIDLRELATEITTALVSQLMGPKMTAAVETLAAADGLIVAAPVYKAAPSGLLTSFFHVLDNDLLIAKPVILAATAGTSRHALVVDEQMRALFAFLRTMTVPTSLFAASEDWSDTDLDRRIDRAALELVLLMESGFAHKVKDESWHSYQHSFGSGGGSVTTVDLDTDLMRLAAGGGAPVQPRA